METREAVRVAHTEALFREVNERIAETADRYTADEAAFVCECSDGNCTHRVEVPLATYEEVREDAKRFLLVPGHEDRRFERVVKRRKGFAVVEKFQKTVAATVERLDPRADAA